MASRVMQRGGDLRSIQALLGHAHLQTTAVYLHTDEQQVRKIADLAALTPQASVADNVATPQPIQERAGHRADFLHRRRLKPAK
jgi:hypothetical protein